MEMGVYNHSFDATSGNKEPWRKGLEDAGMYNLSFEVEQGLNTTARSQNGSTPATTGDPKHEEKDRAQWGSGMEFLMSCIAMSVGLGNIWRFPFTAYENGGGAFLIPYIIVLLVIGRPLYYLEMGLGQFSSRGGVKMFGSLCPALKDLYLIMYKIVPLGVGYGQIIGGALVATYYCSLMATTLYYFINSFTSDLPWANCRPEWEVNNVTCISATMKGNITFSENAISSSELYYSKQVLKEKNDISDGLGVPGWRLILCLFLSWLTTYLVSCRGVSSSGKASYFLALFPYVVMIALLVRACSLKGSAEGILYFIKPDWNKLLSADVWYAAITQCFFSLGVGFGTIIMYSSYNSFDHNINRDALIVTTLDTFTSLLAGVTIFGILGNLAYEMNTDVSQVVKSGGSGLAFISYPDAIAKFEAVPWLFAILFFLMLFVLGVGSLVALHVCVNTLIKDAFPSLKSWQVSGGTALIGFLVGLVYITPGGQFVLNLVDYFGGTFVIFILAILEVYVVTWKYGLQNICDDFHFMTKREIHVYWRVMWGLVTPVVLIVVFVYFIVTMQRLTYAGVDYPDSTLAWGWIILAATIIQVLLWIVYYTYANRSLGFPEAITKSFRGENWGPRNLKDYEEWLRFKQTLREQRNTSQSRIRRYLNSLIGL